MNTSFSFQCNTEIALYWGTRKPGFLPHQVPQALDAIYNKNSIIYFCVYSHLGSIKLFSWPLSLVFRISLILSFPPSISALCYRIKDVCGPWSSHQFSSRDRLYRKLASAKAVSPSIWGSSLPFCTSYQLGGRTSFSHYLKGSPHVFPDV